MTKRSRREVMAYDARFCSGYKWVRVGGYPNEERTKEDAPYGYSAHYLFGSDDTARGCTSTMYSDRLRQQSQERYETGRRAAGEGGWASWTPDAINRYLEAYFPGQRMRVAAVAEACNVSSGFPYWIIFVNEPTDGVSSEG